MLTGVRPESFQRMQLGAGVFLTEFDYSAVTTVDAMVTKIKEAIRAGKTLGATTGGGTFQCVPEVRQIEADGKRYPFTGSTVFDSWTVKLTGTMKEITSSNLKHVLGTAETSGDGSVKKIKVRTDVRAEDYIEHLIWVGDTASGFMLIDLENALNLTGANFTFVDKGEGTLPFEFQAHQSSVDSIDHAPVTILLFEPVATPAAVSEQPKQLEQPQ